MCDNASKSTRRPFEEGQTESMPHVATPRESFPCVLVLGLVDGEIHHLSSLYCVGDMTEQAFPINAQSATPREEV